MVRRWGLFHAGSMSNSFDTTQMPPPPPPPPYPPAPSTRRPLRRSAADRLLGGVSNAVAGALGVSTKVARILFIIAAVFGGIGVVLYAALWLFVPDDYGRIVIQGGAADRKEAAWVAIFSAVASTAFSWWTFDHTGILIPILIGVGVWFLAIRPDTQVPRPPSPLGPPPMSAPTQDPPTVTPPPYAAAGIWPGHSPSRPSSNLPLRQKRPSPASQQWTRRRWTRSIRA